VKINHNTFWFVNQSKNKHKQKHEHKHKQEDALAFAYAYVYAWPYCTKNFIFYTNKHEHKQQSVPLIAEKFGLNLFNTLSA
jgi:hypothetical protein